MFSAIRYYTPTGFPRQIPHIKDNVEKYNDAVRSIQQKELRFNRHRKMLQNKGEDPLETALDMHIESFMARVNN